MGALGGAPARAAPGPRPRGRGRRATRAGDDALRAARDDLAAARSPAARAGLAAVHPPPPAWLEARFAATVAAVRRGEAGPQADAADVAAFLRETYEHVREVDALVRALGGRTRPIPAAAPGDAALRGVHDFGERASVRRVEELIASLRREPLRDREGVPLEVPAWLARLPVEARRAGERSIDVGKLSPHVAAGLSRRGPPDPFALRLHNLAAHHSAPARPGPAVIEEVADMVQAMRQVRVYRPEPMPFDRIAAILEEHVVTGRLPAEARPLIARALEAQARLERTGAVTPYHLLEARPALVDLPLGG
ncbi:MAG: hypothetical protein M9894_12195 [Planctomycetes bacterium]|nr:hypothetical protein [Planctomycetota bacterium]